MEIILDCMSGPNVLTSVFTRRRQMENSHRRGEGNETMEVEPGMMQPRSQECWQPPELGRGKQSLLLQKFSRECVSADTLNLAQ